MASNLFSPLARMVKVSVLGREFEVPEKTTILRDLQFLFPWEISLGDFCWNNECGNCEVIFKTDGDGVLRRTRCCQYQVCEGMRIVEVSKELQSCIKGKLEQL